MSHDQDHVFTSVAVAVNCVLLGVLFPIGLFCAWCLYLRRGHPMLKQRYASLSLLWVLGLLCGMVCASVSTLFVHNYRVLRWIFWLGSLQVWYWILSLVFTRVWMIYYDVQFSKSLARNEWKILIDEDSGEKSWFLTHRETYGNYRYMASRIGIYTLLTGCLWGLLFVVFIWLVKQKEGVMVLPVAVGVIFFVIQLAAVTYVYWQIPVFRDHLFIRQELKMTLHCVSMFYIVFFSVMGLNLAMPGHDSRRAVWIAGNTVSALIFFSLLLISTAYVFAHLGIFPRETTDDRPTRTTVVFYFLFGCLVPHELPEYQRDLEQGSVTHDSRSYTWPARQSRKPEEQARLVETCLQDVLTHPSGYKMFMDFLAYEFCAECLLSYTEFTQFQANIMEYIDCASSGPPLITFPATVPESSIVFKTYRLFPEDSDLEKITKAKLQAHALFDKYVREGCALEINVSGRVRRRLARMFEDMESWMMGEVTADQLIEVFEPCKESVEGLMVNALSRFGSYEEVASTLGDIVA